MTVPLSSPPKKEGIHTDRRDELDELITVEQAAELLYTHCSTIRNAIKSGKLPASKPFRKWLIKRSDLLEFIKK